MQKAIGVKGHRGHPSYWILHFGDKYVRQGAIKLGCRKITVMVKLSFRPKLRQPRTIDSFECPS